MSKKAELWTPLTQVLAREEGFTQWDIAALIPPELDTDSIQIHDWQTERYANKVAGLGSLSIGTVELNNDKTSLASIRRTTTERKLPSSYQHPAGTLLINTGPFAQRLEPKTADSADKEPVLEATFAKDLNMAVCMGIGLLFAERYSKPNSIKLQERMLGAAPLSVGLMAEIFMSAPIYHSLPLAVATYGLITASDYLDARRVLGKDAQPSAWERKRWSISACGVPLDRRVQVTYKIADPFLAKPRTPLVRYAPAA